MQRRREFFLHTLNLSYFPDDNKQCFVSSWQTSDGAFGISKSLEDDQKNFEYFRKTTLTSSFWKVRSDRDSSPSFLSIRYTHAFWRIASTTQANRINHHFSYVYQSCSWPHSGPLYRQNSCSGCNSGINLPVVLKYTFFQLYSIAE